MKIKEIEIKNFRLLNNCKFGLDRDLNVIVGKNNTGKTSLLYCMDKFINLVKTNPFRFEDISTSLQNEIEIIVEKEVPITKDEYEQYYKGISMKMIISYDEFDNITYLSKIMTDLSNDKNEVFLCFKYYLTYEKYLKLREDYFDFKTKYGDRKNVNWFLSRNCNKYFEIKRYGYDIDENNSVNIDQTLLSNIINFSYINAKREVSNDINSKGVSVRSELSKLSYDYLKDNKDEKLKEKIEELNKILIEMDTTLDDQYKDIFKELFNDLIEYGISDEGANLEIQSRLSDINVIQDNTLVLYDVNGTKLPETYNGLGFLNFYALILEINSILFSFKKNSSKGINILIIEEPEAHTHPQMQYVFINNIKKMIEKYKEDINLCSIITTHSAQIMSQAEYDDILCFIKTVPTMVEVKSLKLFLDKYKNSEKEPDKEVYDFLHKYLTLVNSEIFFTDKLIICEGTTERILLPIFIKLCDERKITTKTLRSQKYSIIETGAYSQNLKPLLDLLAIKTLIITDIDFVNKDREKCKYDKAIGTSNSSLNTFLNNPSIEKLKEQKGVYVVDNIGIAFQHEQNGYHARSFEDAYISINYDYLKEKFSLFKSLKCKKDFMSEDFYLIGNKCIESKSTFATEIVYYSDEDFKNINIPSYIEDGLKWISD